MKYELNVQRDNSSKWQNGEYGSVEAVEKAADLWKRLGAYNVNWGGVTTSSEARCVWVVRDGKAV